MTFKKTIQIFVVFIALLSTNVFAENEINIPQLNKQFDTLTIKLASQELDVLEIEKALLKLDDWNDITKKCISFNKAELKKVNEQLSSIQGDIRSKHIQYLNQKKKQIKGQLTECEVLSIRIEDAITSFQNVLNKKSITQLSRKSMPLWSLIRMQKFNGHKAPQSKINITSFKKTINLFTIIISATLLVALLLISIYVQKLIRFILNKSSEPTIITALLTSLHKYAYPLIVFGGFAFVFHIRYQTLAEPLTLLFYQLFLFIILCTIIQFLIVPPEQQSSPLNIQKEKGQRVFYRFILLLVIAFLGFWMKPLLIFFNISPYTIRTVDISMVTLAGLVIAWLGIAISHMRVVNLSSQIVSKLLRLAFILFTLTCIILEWVGYHNFAVYLMRGIFSSLIILLLYWGINYVIKFIFANIDLWFPGIRKTLALKQHRIFIELRLFEILAFILLFYAFILSLGNVWGNAAAVDKINKAFIKLPLLSNFSISPARILFAIFIYAIISIFVRWIAASISRNYTKSGEQEKQVALSSLTLYTGLSVTLIIALLIAGANFTGLAIIAGALSVGVGLGLQNIVNNFFSGIILLLEKPIKAGDRINVGDIEGFVKKVRLRSTQITTLAREDVIVPNSELISKEVTNYMFRDRLFRITCQVGVIYGSDIDKVKKILIDIAHTHPNILKDPPNEPVVLFKAFGDSSLQFELWCITTDVNKKYHILSELNFAINKEFNKHGIVIAFPQRDIHIRSDFREPPVTSLE